METHRLKIKIGQHEFEAEGPTEAVNAQFEAWKELITNLPSAPPEPPEPVREGLQENPEDETPAGPLRLPEIFALDRKRNIVSLRVHPRGERRNPDAILLLLYGAKLLDQEEVMVGRIKEAMAMSGLRVERVDRTIEPYLRSGLVLKGGSGKGGKYRLTNMGVHRSEELIQELGN